MDHDIPHDDAHRFPRHVIQEAINVIDDPSDNKVDRVRAREPDLDDLVSHLAVRCVATLFAEPLHPQDRINLAHKCFESAYFAGFCLSEELHRLRDVQSLTEQFEQETDEECGDNSSEDSST